MQIQATFPPSVNLAVVYHSGSGRTRVLADAVVRGARDVPGTACALVPVEDVETHWSVLDDADALVFGSPTHMAGVSAAMKSFLDSTSSRWAVQAWRDKLAAGFTTSGSPSGDKLATLQHLALFAAQHGMVWIGLGLLPGAAHETNRLGGFLGAMGHTPGAAAPTDSDVRTAEHLGGRVAREALRRAHGVVAAEDAARVEIAGVLQRYFDGLYHCDVDRLRSAFHVDFRYVNATDLGRPHWTLDEYLPVVARRTPPASRGESRTDRILSIDFAGDRAAVARVRCSIEPKRFEDLLTLTRDDHGWRILFKVFHYEVVAEQTLAPNP
ncbi:MAG: hypothetical protein GC161_05450 [Planctomycetaceae bacterium]|nr:hypothetical protein [Planctomycetaceae bacterium]